MCLKLPTPVRFVECHLHVAENAGRVALMRGPLLYCVEQADHPGLDPRDLVVPASPEPSVRFEPNLLGGVAALTFRAEAVAPEPAWENRLYRTVSAHPGDQRRSRGTQGGALLRVGKPQARRNAGLAPEPVILAQIPARVPSVRTASDW